MFATMSLVFFVTALCMGWTFAIASHCSACGKSKDVSEAYYSSSNHMVTRIRRVEILFVAGSFSSNRWEQQTRWYLQSRSIAISSNLVTIAMATDIRAGESLFHQSIELSMVLPRVWEGYNSSINEAILGTVGIGRRMASCFLRREADRTGNYGCRQLFHCLSLDGSHNLYS